MATNMQVANTILSQLGGNRFLAMTGAKNLLGDDNSLMFSIGRNATKCNKVKITLTADDLYTVCFMQFRPSKLDCITLKTVTGIYCDGLRSTFTSFTKLETSL